MDGKEKRPALRFNPQMLAGLIACLWIIMVLFLLAGSMILGLEQEPGRGRGLTAMFCSYMSKMMWSGFSCCKKQRQLQDMASLIVH